MTLEPERSGIRTEYAVRYDAPAEYTGLVSHIRAYRSIAETIARQENSHPGGDFRCVVVERQVTYGDWADSPSSAGLESTP